MKKSFYRVNLALFIALILFVFQANAKDRYVKCDNGQSIQNVLQSSLESAGPLNIYVSGICEENVTIQRDRVSILGEDLSATIRGQVNVYGTNVLISDLRITGPGVGVIVRAGHTRLIRMDISQNEVDGVEAYENAALDIQYSKIHGNGISGIFLASATLNVLESEISRNGLDGILAEVGSNVIIRDTSITENVGAGVTVAFHSIVDIWPNTEVTGNTIGVLVVKDSALRIPLSEGVVITDVDCDDNESSYKNSAGITFPNGNNCTDFN